MALIPIRSGEYIEMGRKMVPGQSEFYMVDENTKGGRWYNRIDESKKVKDCPKGLENYLLECSRSGVTPPSGKMIKMIKKHIFGIEK